MKYMKFAVVLAAVVTLMGVTVAFAQETEERRPSREAWTLEGVEATVEAIDHETRVLTLRGNYGDLVTLEASDEVERLDEIEVGDTVVAEFWTYMKAEFREPTEEEKANPLVAVVLEEKVVEGGPPAGAYDAVVQAVVTIEIINRPDMFVTVLGPGGNYVSIAVEDPELITELQVGEVVVLTYAEALALSLEKADADSDSEED